MNKSGDLGTMAETATARYLASDGWPSAERRRPNGQYDRGDITGCPGLVWEVKGGKAAESASDCQVLDWLVETEIERLNASADFGVLVMKRKGIGYSRAGEWWAVVNLDAFTALRDQPDFPAAIGERPVRLHLSTVTKLFRDNGYGDPL